MKEIIKNILLKYNIEQTIIDEIIETEDFSQFKTAEQVDEIIKNSIMDMQINAELTGEKAKNLVACKALMDKSKITYSDGKISGIKEQIVAIKKENPYLFSDIEVKYTPKGGNNAKNFDSMSDKDYFNYVNKNKGGF